jgi:hypothetical protein
VSVILDDRILFLLLPSFWLAAVVSGVTGVKFRVVLFEVEFGDTMFVQVKNREIIEMGG